MFNPFKSNIIKVFLCSFVFIFLSVHVSEAAHKSKRIRRGGISHQIKYKKCKEFSTFNLKFDEATMKDLADLAKSDLAKGIGLHYVGEKTLYLSGEVKPMLIPYSPIPIDNKIRDSFDALNTPLKESTVKVYTDKYLPEVDDINFVFYKNKLEEVIYSFNESLPTSDLMDFMVDFVNSQTETYGKPQIDGPFIEWNLLDSEKRKFRILLSEKEGKFYSINFINMLNSEYKKEKQNSTIRR